MSLIELSLIAVGVSMDAFTVSICKGLALKNINFKNTLIVGLYFGIFQALMPLIGYSLGSKFHNSIASIDHWIIFILLSVIGFNMIKESREETCDVSGSNLHFKTMLLLAIATSIDALAVGVSFAFLKVSIIPSVIFIGITTFAFSFVGVKIGNVFGMRFKSKSELAGGLILIGMGCKILLESLHIISF